LLELSAIESRKSLGDGEIIDLRDIVTHAIDQARPLAEVADVSIRCDSPPETIHVKGEAFILRAAVTNLLENAIDFSPRGGEVSISFNSTEPGCEISIRDEGPGVPDYARERVFERFYSLRHHSSRRKGTGLGLTLVREAAELHGGSIHLDPADGGGTIARLMLPPAS
jgi:two-component system, OmpR family, sensor histidine kinase CreC